MMISGLGQEHAAGTPPMAPASTSPLCDVVTTPQEIGHAGPRGPLPTDSLSAAWDDTLFWVAGPQAGQFLEHAFFGTLMFQRTDLKRAHSALLQEFENLRRRLSAQPRSREEAVGLINEAAALTQRLLQQQQQARALIDRGEWVGWAFPSFIDHIMLEERYYLSSLSNASRGIVHADRRLTTEETCFYLKVGMDHAIFIAHLLDEDNAIQRQLVNMARQHADGLRRLHGQCSLTSPAFMELAVRATEQLNTFQRVGAAGIKTGMVKSVIHPLLADHVIREANQALRVLRAQAQTARRPVAAVMQEVMMAPTPAGMPAGSVMR